MANQSLYALILRCFIVIAAIVNAKQNDTDSTLELDIQHTELSGTNSHTLSRRKRFLTFPDGSSLQLVFCCQTSAEIAIGDIFLYGNTAALAWELPKDPSLFYMFKGEKGGLLRRGDNVKNIYYTDDKGKLLFKVPYRKKPLVNPAFAKRSIHQQIPASNTDPKEESWITETPHAPDGEFKIDRKQMHASQQRREFLKSEHMSGPSVEFHRHSRKGLYGKLEVFLKALGLNGRQCLLRTLCETGSRQDDKQGTLIEEMLRAVFTLPKGKQFDKDHHKMYDIAHGHGSGANCEELYPECQGAISKLPVFP